mmetsp:Transcript_55629/g.110464  ORF Transcript_55629/g.110464 Transcript_55629/m.110464 type:complete len:80 (+) Transcript_55629:208-447(+)
MTSNAMPAVHLLHLSSVTPDTLMCTPCSSARHHPRSLFLTTSIYQPAILAIASTSSITYLTSRSGSGTQVSSALTLQRI